MLMKNYILSKTNIWGLYWGSKKKLINVLAIYIYVHSELKGNFLSKKQGLVLSYVFVTSEKSQYYRKIKE